MYTNQKNQILISNNGLTYFHNYVYVLESQKNHVMQTQYSKKMIPIQQKGGPYPSDFAKMSRKKTQQAYQPKKTQ